MIVSELTIQIEFIPPENEVLYRQVDAIIKMAREIAIMVDDFPGRLLVIPQKILFGEYPIPPETTSGNLFWATINFFDVISTSSEQMRGGA